MLCSLPTLVGAKLLKNSTVVSMSPNAQPTHVSVTVAIMSVPVVGLWIEICLLHIGLSFGLAGLAIMDTARATMASPFLLIVPQEPDETVGVSGARD